MTEREERGSDRRKMEKDMGDRGVRRNPLCPSLPPLAVRLKPHRRQSKTRQEDNS